MMGGFDLMAAMLVNQLKVQATFNLGTGVALGDQAGCMFCAVARFFHRATTTMLDRGRALDPVRDAGAIFSQSQPRRSSAQMTHQILHSHITGIL